MARGKVYLMQVTYTFTIRSHGDHVATQEVPYYNDRKPNSRKSQIAYNYVNYARFFLEVHTIEILVVSAHNQ